MDIKKIVKLSFLLILILIILVGILNYVVLRQIKNNSFSQKYISELVLLQEQMNLLSKDLMNTNELNKLKTVQVQFTQAEQNFESVKKIFLNNPSALLDELFFDIHSDKNLSQKLHMLFKNEKDIEKAFRQAYTLHQEKIHLMNQYKSEYPIEIRIRQELENKVLQTGDYVLISDFGNLKYYSKEALYQNKSLMPLDQWLIRINDIKNKTNIKQFDAYINIVKSLRSKVYRIHQINLSETKILENIFKILKQNNRVNAQIQHRIETISSGFITSSNFFVPILLGVVICFILYLAYRVNKNVGLSVDEIQRRVEMGLDEINKLDKEIIETQKEVIFTMGTIGEQRSRETGNHVKRVAEYSKLFARFYGLSEEETEMIGQVSPMHDIGKVAIPDSILNKPGRLDEQERTIMDTHATLGYEMLKGSNKALLKMAAIVAKEHHEKWDGSGYPEKKAGEEIHIFGRITAIADVFDALGSDRVYKKAWKDEDIFVLFKQEKGRHFEPKLVDIFFENLDEFLQIRNRLKD
ncbi:HD-GYP domain-containing protein [Sulfurospirillum sp. 1612]|uniref:HD-GYP domain-containing protein n=1 Tax=Sulfurospirillum sp. 1612 TaxID=3094835 RepID=UPI002F926C69